MICICQYCGKHYSTYEEAQACEKSCKEKAQAREQKKLQEKEYWGSGRKTIQEGNQMFQRNYALTSHQPFSSSLFGGTSSSLLNDLLFS